MDENNDLVIEERKKKLIAMFNENKWFAGYSIVSGVSLVMIILSLIGLISFPWIHSLILLIIGLVACALTYFNKGKYAIYLFVIWPVWIATYIRTRNLGGLKDIATGTWTLGPDLDPFLFLRWAKYILEHGSLMTLDTMRFVPLGYSTKAEMVLLPYMIAWFHKITFALGITESLNHSAVLFPVFMFVITVVAFFIFVREIFIESVGKEKANIIALVSSFFLGVIPALLPRTIAGIPEKESVAFFFMFLTLYLFLLAWKSKGKYMKYILSLLSGLSSAGMALVWGGFFYIHLTIAISLFFSLIIYKIDKDKLYESLIWLVSSSMLMSLFSERYALSIIFKWTVIGINEFVILSMAVYLILNSNKVGDYLKNKRLTRVQSPIFSVVIAIVLTSIAAIILFGPGFFVNQFKELTTPLVTPINDRLGITVAENKQPYFNEWAYSFGPVIGGFPVFFWLFMIGSIYLYYNMFHGIRKKERFAMTFGYFVFLMAIIYSRYSPQSILNGTNAASILFYLFGVAALLFSFGYYYYRRSKEDNIEGFKEVNFGVIMLFSLFFFSVISARGAIRVIMVLVPSASIMASYLTVSLFMKVKDMKKDSSKLAGWIVLILIMMGLIISGYRFYIESEYTAQNYVPYAYTYQWQKAMSWVRESTPADAVFGHWWDYGYWVQSIGERATMVDGGNAIPYWNHFMGRYGLTGQSSREAAEMLYPHNVTHFLIDSTDIGKYTAFASIGSDKDYDRRSWINTFVADNKQTVELKNKTVRVYTGGFSLDEDLIYSLNGTRIFLPGLGSQDINKAVNLAGVGAVVIEIDSKKQLSQPVGIFVYQNKQYNLPLRYSFYNGEFTDFGSGVEAGVFLMQKIDATSNGQATLDDSGALIYLSGRVVKSQFARLYLYGEEDEYFKLAHDEPDLFMDNLRSNGINVSDFVYYNGVRGPIKIWSVSYPEDIEFKKEFLNTQWPKELERV